MLGALSTTRFAGLWTLPLANLFLWFGFLCAFVYALARSRPPGLFQFRASDLIWGFASGMVLRLCEGVVGGFENAPFPSSPLIENNAIASWVLAEAIPLGLIGPLAEEVFFRAVILVSVFQVLRRATGPVAAAITAALVSTGLFVCLHAIFGAISLASVLQFVLIGTVCAALVLLTGRLWSAVVTHLVYNGSYLAIVAMGALLVR
ncbi:CPBP family intramembrane glutamic endopeptidase [Microbacterium testaceum]|nr:CPBP family intramembrane glutamic endopeptidase [Microbacterium testaceum]